MSIVWTIQPALAATQGTADVAQQFERSLMAIEDGSSNLPRDRFDPQYVVDQVGIEPEALYDWVKYSISWVPYAGMLRGAKGTLMDRQGNALDRALLLAELLRAAGSEVRLAHARLSAAQTEGLWSDLVAASATSDQLPLPPAQDSQPPGENLDPTAMIESYELDAGAVMGVLDEVDDTTQRLQDDLFIRSVVHWGRLVDQGVVPKEAGPEARVTAAKVALSDHWWVELDRDGTWVPLDTLAPSVEFGAALTQAAETYAIDALPEASAHTVTIKVVAEQIKDGQAQENALLGYTLRAADAIGQRITLGFLPTRWPPDWQTTTPEVFQQQLKAAALTQTEWIPVLTAGGQQLAEASVLDTGELNPNPDLNSPFGALGVPAAGGVGRVIDLFGEDGGTDGAAAPGRADGEFSALWIDYEIRVPGRPARTVRRESFDLLGPAKRAAGAELSLTLTDADRERRSVAMLGETQILIQVSELAPEFMMQLSADAALANRPFLEEMARDPFGGPKADLTETLQKMVPGPSSLDLLAMARFANSGVRDRVYIAEPNVLAQHVELVQNADRDFFGRLAIDIVSNEVAVQPLATGDAANLRLVQGVVDSNAELLVLADAPHLYGAAELFEQVGPGGAPWVTLQPGDQVKLAALGLPDDVTARIGTDLAAGYMIVAPSVPDLAPVQIGYWRVDPASGTTLGIGANGWGVSLVEYAFVLVIKTALAEMVCQAQAGIAAVAKAKAEQGEGYSIRGKGQDTFTKASAAAFKLCMATALFGGFMLMAQTPIMGSSTFPKGPSVGMDPSAVNRRPPEPRINNGPKPTERYGSPTVKPPQNAGSRPPGSRPPDSAGPPGQQPPRQPPPGPPPPRSQDGNPPQRPTRAEVQQSLKESRQKWDDYANATRDRNMSGEELNRRYNDAVKAEEQAKQKGFKDYVGNDFDAAAHERLKHWAEDSHGAYRGMEQPANTKVTPPGQSGNVDPGAITQVDKGNQQGPITQPGATGGGAGPPSSGPPSSGASGSPGGGPGTASSGGWDGYPFASPGMDQNPPSYTPPYRPPPPPSSKGFPVPSAGGGPAGSGLTSSQEIGGGTDYPFGSPQSNEIVPPTQRSPGTGGAAPETAPVGIGIGGIAAGLKSLGQ